MGVSGFIHRRSKNNRSDSAKASREHAQGTLACTECACTCTAAHDAQAEKALPKERCEDGCCRCGARPQPGNRRPVSWILLWSTSLLAAIQGIMARSLAPTCSISDSAFRRRRDMSVGAPAAFSRMKLLAYSPVWISLRH